MNLTKHGIAALPTPKSGQHVGYYDSRVLGLGVQVQPSGNRVWFWFRKIRGRRTWRTLGDFPDLSVEQARDKAQEINAALARWKASDYQGDSPFEKRHDLTLGFVFNDYVERHLRSAAKNPDKAVRAARWQFGKYVPHWRERKLSTIRRDQVLALYHDTRKKIGVFTANRTIQLLRAPFNWAITELKWTGGNPAQIKLTSEAPYRRARFLQGDELARLFKALREESSRDLRDFIIISLFTGARSGDVLSMRWEHVNFETTSWLIPNPKSRIPYIVPLLPEAVEILQERRKGRTDKSLWIFPGSGKTGHLIGFKHSWPALLKRTKLTGLRIHDLRRTLGSWMATGGTSLPIIGKVLGHTSLGRHDSLEWPRAMEKENRDKRPEGGELPTFWFVPEARDPSFGPGADVFLIMIEFSP